MGSEVDTLGRWGGRRLMNAGTQAVRWQAANQVVGESN